MKKRTLTFQNKANRALVLIISLILTLSVIIHVLISLKENFVLLIITGSIAGASIVFCVNKILKKYNIQNDISIDISTLLFCTGSCIASIIYYSYQRMPLYLKILLGILSFVCIMLGVFRLVIFWRDNNSKQLLGKTDVEQFAYLALDVLPSIIGEYPQVTDRDKSYYGISMLEYRKIEEIYLKRLGLTDFVPACRDITLFRNLIAKKVKEIVEEDVISDLLDTDIISIEEL